VIQTVGGYIAPGFTCLVAQAGISALIGWFGFHNIGGTGFQPPFSRRQACGGHRQACLP